MAGAVPEGPAVVPVVGPPVGWAEAHGDLEDLSVHHMSHHAKKTWNNTSLKKEEKKNNTKLWEHIKI